MIEVNTTYDFLPGIDHHAYGERVQKAIGLLLQAPGFVELRAYRNILGSLQVRTSSVWQTLADWATFSQGTEWQAFEAEIRAFTTNIRTELWGPSPALPEPLRPGK